MSEDMQSLASSWFMVDRSLFEDTYPVSCLCDMLQVEQLFKAVETICVLCQTSLSCEPETRNPQSLESYLNLNPSAAEAIA